MIIRRIYATLTRGSDYINLPQGALAKSQLFSMSMLPFIFSGLGIRDVEYVLSEQCASTLPCHSQASQLVSVSLGARTPIVDACAPLERRRAMYNDQLLTSHALL